MWRKQTANYPVIPWPSFIDKARSRVNMLASEEHMKELIQQLQILGEVRCLTFDFISRYSQSAKVTFPEMSFLDGQSDHHRHFGPCFFQVIYLETAEEHDLVVLDPHWLGMDVIGHLLSHDSILNARPTGCFTADDFQLIFADAEAKDILQVISATVNSSVNLTTKLKQNNHQANDNDLKLFRRPSTESGAAFV